MAKLFYPAVVESAARGLIGVWFPDFPECVAAGATQEEAIQKAEARLAHHVDGLAERDGSMPAATPMEKISARRDARFIAFVLVGVEPPDASERVNIYLPKSLIARADKRAAELGMSRSSFFGFSIRTVLGFGAATFFEGQWPRTKVQQTPTPNKPKSARSKRKSEKK